MMLGGQGHDGASVMSGKCGAVAARIKAGLNILYCALHSTFLNLVKVDAVKSSLRLTGFFSLLQKFYVYASGSYIYIYYYFFQPEMAHSSKRNIPR